MGVADETQNATALNTVLTRLSVDIATIKENAENQKETLRRVEGRLESGVFREEYERRHKEVEDIAHEAQRSANDALRKTRDAEVSGRAWRWVFTSALTIFSTTFGGVLVYFHHPG